MFNKSNHKVENFSKELETKKEKKSNENSGTENKVNLQYAATCSRLGAVALYAQTTTQDESRVRSLKPFPHVFRGQHNRVPKLDKDNNETLQANFSHEHKVKLQTNMNRSNPVIKCGLF